MEIELLTDLIKDERGNYYTAVRKDTDEVTLVNALVERSYRRMLRMTEAFQEEYAAYDGQWIGKIAADDLRHDIVFAMKEDGAGRLYTLEDVMSRYRVHFIDTVEFYRSPARG